MKNFGFAGYDNVVHIGTNGKMNEFSAAMGLTGLDIPGDLLNDGTYTIRLLIVRDESRALLDLNNLLVFEVHDTERTGNWHGKWIGAVRPNFDWELKIGR